MAEICVDVWGDFALFCRPEQKVDRMTYDVPTPSGCRGILNAIYSKPDEFYYEIAEIDVMRPIRYVDIKKNEVRAKVQWKGEKTVPVDSAQQRTQRGNVYLKDVYYRIYANIVKRDDMQNPRINEAGLKKQFLKRVEKGKCFFQPYLGTKECMCFFGPPEENMKPISESKDLGVMLYDVFDIRSNIPLNTDPKNRTGGTVVSFYHPIMTNGVIKVPGYETEEVFKPGRRHVSIDL